ncbi:hypothetical protein [Flaviaesturariibacter amylovorans]|uniref:VWFA domain-containing protein n=1 Tax=Flaviaesturariibacter amylovorans TaxID=1084520 RepID=A0ABP8HUX9_9BACT
MSNRYLALGLLLAAVTPLVFSFRGPRSEAPPAPAPKNPRVQVALLLDVSNSMDGLIDQAKAQLWSTVQLLGRAQCPEGAPKIEIALYEYGRTSNNPAAGYVKRITPFTSNLDSLSLLLFALKTNGGEEYCGQAISTSVKELDWDTAAGTYKVAFIAGNESFRQGSVQYTQACLEARQRGIILNTIYCGDRMSGIRDFWDLGAECGTGNFTSINSNSKLEDIPTPYDSTLITLNSRFNGTHIAYGRVGASGFMSMETADVANVAHSRKTAAARIAVKGKKSLYKNVQWDLIDAATDDKQGDSIYVAKMNRSELPDSLKKKSNAELLRLVRAKNAEREAVRQAIEKTSAEREQWLAAERRKRAQQTNEATLETEMEKILKEQAGRFGYRIQ